MDVRVWIGPGKRDTRDIRVGDTIDNRKVSSIQCGIEEDGSCWARVMYDDTLGEKYEVERVL
jgi:hypothetical protein